MPSYPYFWSAVGLNAPRKNWKWFCVSVILSFAGGGAVVSTPQPRLLLWMKAARLVSRVNCKIVSESSFLLSEGLSWKKKDSFTPNSKHLFSLVERQTSPSSSEWLVSFRCRMRSTRTDPAARDMRK